MMGMLSRAILTPRLLVPFQYICILEEPWVVEGFISFYLDDIHVDVYEVVFVGSLLVYKRSLIPYSLGVWL